MENPLVQQFLDYLRLERHFSPYTARCYGADLRQFGEFLAGEPGATAAGPKGAETPCAPAAAFVGADTVTLRRFLSHLDSHGYSPATMARKIATLRSFYKFLHRRGILAANPMLMIRSPKQGKRLPKAM